MLLFKCCLSGSGGCELAEGSQRGGSVFLSLGDGWGMRLGFILAEGRMAMTGGPGEPAWYFGFYPLPSCWPPTAPVSWFQVRLLGGRRQGQDWHYDCMIENFSFCCFIFFTGGWGGAGFLPSYCADVGIPRLDRYLFPLASCYACGWSWAPAHGGTELGLSSAPLPRAAQACAGIPTPHLLSSLSFPSFSPFLSLLSPHLPSTPSALPTVVPAGISRGDPLPNVRSARFSTFLNNNNNKRCRMLPGVAAGDQNFQKNWANTFPFLSQELLLLPGLSRGDRALPEVVTAEVQVDRSPLVSAHSHKLQVRGGGEGEIMKFLIKKKKIKVCIYIYVVTI